MHFDDYLRAFAFPRPIHDRVLRAGLTLAGTSAMRVALKTKPAAVKFLPEEEEGRRRDDHQGNHLLPVHAGKITSFFLPATGDLSAPKAVFPQPRSPR